MDMKMKNKMDMDTDSDRDTEINIQYTLKGIDNAHWHEQEYEHGHRSWT